MKKRLKTQQQQKVTSAEQSSPEITDEDLTCVTGGSSPDPYQMYLPGHGMAGPRRVESIPSAWHLKENGKDMSHPELFWERVKPQGDSHPGKVEG